MREISESSWLYKMFDNSLTRFLGNFNPCCEPPSTDCKLFWGLFMNTFLYAWMMVIVFMLPLSLMVVVDLFVMDSSWFIGGYSLIYHFLFGADLSIPEVFLLFFTMAVPFVLSYLFWFMLVVGGAGLILIGAVAAICKVIFDEDNMVGGLISDRWDGIKNNYCKPIKWVKADE